MVRLYGTIVKTLRLKFKSNKWIIPEKSSGWIFVEVGGWVEEEEVALNMVVDFFYIFQFIQPNNGDIQIIITINNTFTDNIVTSTAGWYSMRKGNRIINLVDIKQ